MQRIFKLKQVTNPQCGLCDASYYCQKAEEQDICLVEILFQESPKRYVISIPEEEVTKTTFEEGIA